MCLLAAIHARAQSPYIVQYTTDDGLPSNRVYQVYQDSRNFIWFATDAGVARFDGSSFVYLKKSDGLSTNDIIKIKEDRYGRLWMFSLNAEIDLYQDNMLHNRTKAPFLDSLKASEFFRDFDEDHEGNLIFYYNHQRDIFILDTAGKVRKYKMPHVPFRFPENAKPTDGMVIRYLNRTTEGAYNLWASSGIYRLKDLDSGLMPESGRRFCRAVYPLGNGELMAQLYRESKGSTNHYDLVRYDRDLKPVPGALPIRLETTTVSSVIEDREGILWISTLDKGVFCYRNGERIRHFDINQAQAVIQDHNGDIWISSLNDGVFKLSRHVNQHLHFPGSLFGNSGIVDLSPHLEKGIWLTSGQSIFLLEDNQIFTLGLKEKDKSFGQLLQVDQQTLVAGESNSQYYAYKGIALDRARQVIRYTDVSVAEHLLKNVILSRPREEFTAFSVFLLISYSPGQLFHIENIVTIRERIFNIFYNIDDQLVVNAKSNYILNGGRLLSDPRLQQFNGRVITQYRILDGSCELYITDGDSIYLSQHGTIKNLSSRFDQPFDRQVRFIDYHDSVLYLATTRNIYLCSKPQSVFIDKPVSLQPIGLNFRNIKDMLVNDHSLYIASDDGLTVIPDTMLLKIGTTPPEPYLKSIFLNDAMLVFSGAGLEADRQSRIGIGFGSISFASGPMTYAYKLEDRESDWHVGEGTEVVYQDLPKGEYRFLLKARTPTSGWSEPVGYPIRIRAAFWENPMFFVGFSLLLSVMIILLLNWRKNIKYRRKETEHQLILLEQKALQSMMNPHFIFNTLGSIQNFLIQNKPSEAGLYLSQFARLIRQNLSSINTSMIRLEEEVDRLKNYLDLEKIRLEDRFSYRIIYEEGLKEEDLSLPAMIIQPFVENAVWHGISTLEKDGMITIRFTRHDPQTLMIVIEDNGIGIARAGAMSRNREKHFHLGMQMTRKRLELLGRQRKADASVTITYAFPGQDNPGTRVVIITPCSCKGEAE